MAMDAGMAGMQQMNSMANNSALMGAQMAQENNSTSQQIQTIQTQMQAENMKAQQQRHQIMVDTMNKCREMANESMNGRAKTSDKNQKQVHELCKS